AEHVIGFADVCDPVAHRFIDRILQRLAPRRDGNDAGAEQFHPEYVQFLAPNVLLAHIDVAFESEPRTGRRRSDAVLSGASLRDDALLAHAPREQSLAKAVVDLVRAGMIQIFALEIDLRAAPCL